jgi:hyperosmotically inducible protein
VTDNLLIAPAASARVPASDGFIKARIYTQLTADAALEGSDVDVDVKGGVVSLKGTVRSDAGRTRAVAIAKGVAGVKSVTDTLTITTRR